ncbi:O-antigen ligase family protein [Terrimicrobium sacchariphilum]|nr:O-antigen ligase family protein [Terrimicrobium sacchariphilum]
MYLDSPLALPGQIMRRAHGLYQNPNHLAWFLNAIGLFAISLACLGRGRAWQKVIFAYAGIVCLVGGLLCLSRGGVIALIAGSICLVGLAITALVASGSGRRWAVSSLLIAAIVIPATIVIVFASQSVTFQARATQLLSDDYRSRLSLTSLRHLQVSPLFGTGAGTYIDYSRLYRDGSTERDDYQAHNDWLQISGEYGFVALFLFLFAVALHMRSGWIGYLSALRTRLALGSLPQSNSSAVLMGALSGATMFGVHSLFDFNLQVASNALLAAAVAGMLAGQPQSGGEGRQPTSSRIGRYLYGGALGAVSLGLILSLWSSRSEVWTLIAENGVIDGNLGSASLSAEKALSIGPKNAWTQFVAGGVASANAESLKGAGRQEEVALSRERFLEAARLAETERVFHTSLVYVALGSGDLDLAEKEAVDVIRRDPLRPVGWEQLGVIAQQKGDMPSALRYYGIASSLTGTSLDREKLKELQDRVRARALEAR